MTLLLTSQALVARRSAVQGPLQPLAASLAAFIGFFVIARLPQPWHPVFEIDGFERATIDRYWLAVDAADPKCAPDRTIRELSALSPLRLVQLEPER